MKTDRNGGPGMSKRDWFAGQALVGLIAHPDNHGETASFAKIAYEAADAMLAAGGHHPDQTALDTAWAQINALGGTAEPGDEAGAAVNRTVDQALAIIEALGGRDPLKRRAAA